jgi:DNA-binding FadR family transcriptional regulator
MRQRITSQRGAERIREFILRGVREHRLKPGDRLPTEREFESRFDTARSAVRRVMAKLSAEGVVVRTVGRGTEIANPRGLPATAAGVDASPAEIIDARLKLEPAFVELAVINATSADFDRMRECLARARRAASVAEFEHWDDALHRAVAAATHNSFVMRVAEMISAARLGAAWGRLKQRSLAPALRSAYQREHLALVTAIERRDAKRACERMVEHLRHVRASVSED